MLRAFNFVLYQFVGIATIIAKWLFGLAAQRISQSIRGDFFDKIIEKDVAFFDDDENTTGGLSKYLSMRSTEPPSIHP